MGEEKKTERGVRENKGGRAREKKRIKEGGGEERKRERERESKKMF